MSKGLPFSIEFLTSSDNDVSLSRTPSPVDIQNIPKDLEVSSIFSNLETLQGGCQYPDTLPRLPADIDFNSISMLYGGEPLRYTPEPQRYTQEPQRYNQEPLMYAQSPYPSYSPPPSYAAPLAPFNQATTPTPSESTSSEVSSSAESSPTSTSGGSPKVQKKKSPKSDEKPEISYITLISLAILNAPNKKIVLSDIYSYIINNYGYYQSTNKSWRNSIRHNLSLNECFIKVGRSDNGKGNYWTIHPACIEDFERGDFRRRNARRRAKRGCRDLSLPEAPVPFSLPEAPLTSAPQLPYFKPYPMQYQVPSSHPYPSMYYPSTSHSSQVPPSNMYHSGSPYLPYHM